LVFDNDRPALSSGKILGIVGVVETAASKTRALQTLREVGAAPVFAKRLECVRVHRRFRLWASGSFLQKTRGATSRKMKTKIEVASEPV